MPAYSAELAGALSDQGLLNRVIEVSPRLEQINRIYTRLYWRELLQAQVNGQKEFTITEDELQLFRNTDGSRTIREVFETLGMSVNDYGLGLSRMRRLIRLGGIDIVG